MALEVKTPGLQTTVQDEGRISFYAAGMPPSGAMDKASYRVGNLLVGNPDGLASLEITYLGPDLEVKDDTVIAVTGAQMGPKLNGEPISSWRSYAVKAGDVVSFGYIQSAPVPTWRRPAASTYPRTSAAVRRTRSAPSVLRGPRLQAGDVVPVGAASTAARRALPENLRPRIHGDIELRVVVGLASYRLVPQSLEMFLSTS